MGSVWRAWGDVLVACAAGLPLAAAAVWLLVRLRPRRPVRFAVAEVLLVGGTLPWLWMILTPDPAGSRRLCLVPLHDLATLAPRDAVVQIGGNLLVFAALGALLPVRFPVGLPTVLWLAATASAGVELAQYLLDLHRVSSVDDVLVNTAGAVLAACCSRPWWRTARPPDDGRTGTPAG